MTVEGWKAHAMHKLLGGAFALVATMLGLLPASGRTAGARAPQAPETRAVMVVSREPARGEFQVEPLAVILGRDRFEEPAAAGDSGDSSADFSKRYFKSGTKYSLLYGGAEAGTVTIRGAVQADCSPVSARANVSTSVRLGRDSLALATDTKQGLRARSSRSTPTAGERAAALRLAKSGFRQEGIKAASVAGRLTALDLAAIDLNGDGRAELVGTYLVKSGPKVRDELFLVAAPRGGGYVAELSKHERLNARDIMDPSAIGEVGKGGFLAEMFIDQFDADGDGVGEFFTASASFEGTTYRAYKRVGESWRAIYEHYSYRCAY